MPGFKKLSSKVFQKDSNVLTEDNIYWKQYEAPAVIKEFGPIDNVDFSSVEPHYFAVTCSVRVQVYNPITKLVVKNLSRFRENAYGAVFRRDGKLIVSGGEEACVKLFNVTSKSLLRLFKGHKAAVHRTLFLDEQPQIVSFSDDRSVRVWDIGTESQLHCFEGVHGDYVRAGAVNSAIPNLFLSGGYDGVVKMFDLRVGSAVAQVSHGSPVEKLLFLPSGGMFLSCGGTQINIWDTMGGSGGSLVGCLSQHHKTITCLTLSSNNKRLLSGSLDRHVKIYDLSTFKTVHTLDYPNGVLSLGIAPNDETLVAGLVDGLLYVTRRQAPKKDKPKAKTATPSYRYKTVSNPTVDEIIQTTTFEKEAAYDKCLRKFEYTKALETVLIPYVMKKTPHITVTLVQELIRRKGLGKAFRGLPKKHLVQVIKFFIRNFTDPRFTNVLIDATNVFLDEFQEEFHLLDADLLKLIDELSMVLKQEQEHCQILGSLEGMISMLLTSNSVSHQTTNAPIESLHLKPSANAQNNLIVNLT